METKKTEEIIVNDPIEVKPNKNITLYRDKFDSFIEDTKSKNPQKKSIAIKKALDLISFLRN